MGLPSRQRLTSEQPDCELPNLQTETSNFAITSPEPRKRNSATLSLSLSLSLLFLVIVFDVFLTNRPSLGPKVRIRHSDPLRFSSGAWGSVGLRFRV